VVVVAVRRGSDSLLAGYRDGFRARNLSGSGGLLECGGATMSWDSGVPVGLAMFAHRGGCRAKHGSELCRVQLSVAHSQHLLTFEALFGLIRKHTNHANQFWLLFGVCRLAF
jgi:hypothetical protein